MTFAEQLKSQRQRLGLTQSETAELLEVSPSWVDKAEREIRTPIKITQEGAIARLSEATLGEAMEEAQAAGMRAKRKKK